MKKKWKPLKLKIVALFSLGLLAIGIASGSAQAPPADPNLTQIKQLQAQYVQSVDTLDPKLINATWSHDVNVSFIHPLGTEIGLQQIKDNLYTKIMGLFSKRDLILENPEIYLQGDSAWSEMTWTFHATLKNDGKDITTTGRETQIYLKENGVWHLVHVHYSGPPITNIRKGV